MPKINNSVDFIDNDDHGNLIQTNDDKAKHKRAGLAHKLAVVLLFDRHHQNLKSTKTEGKSKAGKRGALDMGE